MNPELSWYQSVGGNRSFLQHQVPSPEEISRRLRPLEQVRRLIVHHSGFTSGNAHLLRWYHQRANAWADVGYHYIIGNGRGGHSSNGGIEEGRDPAFQGAHVKGHNDDSLGICLIDNADHFRKNPPSARQQLALENLLVHLMSLHGGPLQVLRHSDLARKSCPGTGVPLEDIRDRALRRLDTRVTASPRRVTLDLRRLFRSGDWDWRRPGAALPHLQSLGVDRLVLPHHWRDGAWEAPEAIRSWVQMAHDEGWPVLVYTGPFGTERPQDLPSNPAWEEWLQRDGEGRPATYGGMLMFCPSAPYWLEHRLPVIRDLLDRVPLDGVFFDIPWFMAGACHCSRCRSPLVHKKSLLSRSERAVRSALARGILALRRQHPRLWVVANVGAPGVWEIPEKGATPRSLSGLCDELVVELSTGRNGLGMAHVHRALQNTGAGAPGCYLSHACLPGTGTVGPGAGVGRWASGLVDDQNEGVPFEPTIP
jgi:N-acetylmuramoyl-L-alanine amidase